MPRATSDSVKAVIETDVTILLDPFIAAANELVTECCGLAGYTDTRLAMIETWLAAHFYAIRDMRTSSESAGGVSQSFQNRVDLVLANTMYGQQAMMLDTNGGLALLNIQATKGKRRVGVHWVGDVPDTNDDVIQ